MIVDIIEIILALIKQILPAFLPSDLQKIKDQIAKMEKDRDEKKQKFLKALAENDIPTLNLLISELLG